MVTFELTLENGETVKLAAYDSWEAVCLAAAKYKHSPVASFRRTR